MRTFCHITPCHFTSRTGRASRRTQVPHCPTATAEASVMLLADNGEQATHCPTAKAKASVMPLADNGEQATHCPTAKAEARAIDPLYRVPSLPHDCNRPHRTRGHGCMTTAMRQQERRATARNLPALTVTRSGLCPHPLLCSSGFFIQCSKPYTRASPGSWNHEKRKLLPL